MKCAIAFFILLAVGAVGAWTAHGALMASLGASTALEVAHPLYNYIRDATLTFTDTDCADL